MIIQHMYTDNLAYTINMPGNWWNAVWFRQSYMGLNDLQSELKGMQLCFSCFFLSIKNFRLLWKLWNSSYMLPNTAVIYWMLCIQTGFLKIPKLVTESVSTHFGEVDEMNFRSPFQPKLFFLQVYT